MNHTKKAQILFIRGIPGSGKSYVASNLVNAMKDREVVLLDPDAIDFSNPAYKALSEELSAQDLPEAIHPFRWLRGQAVAACKPDTLIIWNQPFTNEGILSRLAQFLTKAANDSDVELEVLILELETASEIAYERIQKRIADGGHGPSKDTFDHRVEHYISFADSHKTLVIDGTNNIDEITTSVLEFLA